MAQNNDSPGKRLKREEAKYKPTPFVAKAAEDFENYFEKNAKIINGVKRLPPGKEKKRIAIPESEYDKRYKAMEDSLGTSYYTHSLLDQLKQGVPAADALKSLSGSFDVEHIAKPVRMSNMRKNVAPVKTIVTTDKYGQKVSVPIYAQPKTYVPDKYEIEKGFWDKIGDQVSYIDRNYINPVREGITPTYAKPKIEEVRKTISSFIDKYNPFSSIPRTTAASNKEGQLIDSAKIIPRQSESTKSSLTKPQATQDVLKIIAPVSRKTPAAQKLRQIVAKKEPVIERKAIEIVEPLTPRQAPSPIFSREEIIAPVPRPVDVPPSPPMEEPMMEKQVVTERPVARKPPKAVMPRRHGGWSNQPLLMSLFPKLYER